MSVLAKYQENNLPRFEFDNNKVREFTNLQQLDERFPKQTFVIHAMFINKKSRFGDSPVLVLDDYSVNLPQHLTDTVKAMIQDIELVDAVNKRQIGFNIYTYQGSHGIGYSINWVEL